MCDDGSAINSTLYININLRKKEKSRKNTKIQNVRGPWPDEKNKSRKV